MEFNTIELTITDGDLHAVIDKYVCAADLLLSRQMHGETLRFN